MHLFLTRGVVDLFSTTILTLMAKLIAALYLQALHLRCRIVAHLGKAEAAGEDFQPAFALTAAATESKTAQGNSSAVFRIRTYLFK